MRNKAIKVFSKYSSTDGTISLKKIVIVLCFILQINLLLSRLLESKTLGIHEDFSPMASKADLQILSLPLLFTLSLLSYRERRLPQIVAPALLSVASLPVAEASWLTNGWKSLTKGAGLFGNALKSLFSPGDYLMPNLDPLFDKANRQAKEVVHESGLEARVTIQEAGKEAERVLNGFIEKANGTADQLIIKLGSEGQLLIEKAGRELRFTADETLRKASREGQIMLELAGFQAQLAINESGTELRSVITHAGNEVRSVSYELPRLARLVSSSFIAGAAEELKHQLFGSSELQRVMRDIDQYMRETSSPSLQNLLDYVTGQNHLSGADKANLYTHLIRYVNVPSIEADARHKIYLIIGAIALNDEKLLEEVDWYFFSYMRNYTDKVLQAIPDNSAKAILASGNETKFLSSFGMLTTPAQFSDGSVPVGTIVAFPEHVSPGDFCECAGQEYPVELMEDLFAIIGKRYGFRVDEGGKAYFKIPDYRGYFLRGWDHDTDLGSAEEDATRMPRLPFKIENAGSHIHETLESGHHSHGMSEDGEHTHSFEGAHKGWSHGNGHADRAEYWGPKFTSASGRHIHSIFESGKHTHTISSAGEHGHLLSGGDSETRPKNKNVKFMIKYRSSTINLHKQIAELKSELADTRTIIKEKYLESLFFTRTVAAATGVAIASTIYFRR